MRATPGGSPRKPGWLPAGRLRPATAGNRRKRGPRAATPPARARGRSFVGRERAAALIVVLVLGAIGERLLVLRLVALPAIVRVRLGVGLARVRLGRVLRYFPARG